MKSLVSFLVLLFAAIVHAISSSGDRLLVVLEDVAEKDAYSEFLGDLEGRGFQINYETPKSEGLRLFHLGEKSYDHVLFLPTKSKGLGPNLTPQILLDFINANGNILLALSASQPAPTSIVSLLLELDIHLPPDRQGLVVDHFNYDVLSASEKHDVLLLPPPGPLRADVNDFFSPESSSGELIAFPAGMPQTLGSGALLAPILRAPDTSYSYNPKEQAEIVDELFASGAQLSLVSTLQARNSARFTVLGSADLLSDKWFDAKVKKAGEKKEVATANRDFAKRISAWTFKETGVLRVNWIEHHLNEAGQSNASNPKIYRIKNDVTYSISLSEYSWDKYIPFTVPESDDLQLEFSMLSPFHRLHLEPTISSEDSTTYSVSFKLPDQHGIFNFKVNYKRPFYTNVEEKNTVSVRHFAHDEWPRSFVISGAYPWIAGIASTVVGWIAFCGIWLYSKPTATKESKKTQ
ncbi:Dolichyl-diphosphooligosaccharide-protein glycosyltransferase 48kDa subunit [Hypoxylon trugodes]|uniref:Dolichyl-diphosphooligosaccharide-protein glycosyltransferase 48kDa subunit n=1 Tax=Hypoxylon trugodes TaxID=326681 RepID=UPI00219956FF|nr:Dolichyl-diphosphooligosaccharide-protein glycosyltransferase 48kDa subunit [Hypoxylon trugodes]KAI1392102.1 Dolichyl-diphosphooligosaccharide-protein glycosyltransferase 48kDa subunit [Hypoxylon trugodes]